ncbi:hypothetical protein AYL99_00403 [Fonsecaea erecta]|uniref:Glycosyl hydrolase family 13 catalytic domain-containing protein n=1 Tax=Fonsecaea erecta TaxID=1367422 RepID=A0A178ZYN8_9EURO|nr:hypothetical protein AYL99_00403 [Fonsecaea erecta]OAP64431.1 hypothetical protein AYL99_00403 [Fonsecaea erecta]
MIWICPIYKSPWSDYGYDIADYYTVSEDFGTNKDLDNLIAKSRAKGLGIQEALKDPNSKYREYYYFKEGIGGQPPNNWRFYFGGSAWEPVPNEDNMFYLHAYTTKMADLNWENTELKQELYTMINWWIGKGIAGFRIDAIMNIKKTMVEGHLEPDGDDGLVAIVKYILNQPGLKDLIRDLKDNAFAKHDIMTLAEAAVPDDELEDFVGRHGFFNMSFDFRAADIDVPGSAEWYYPTDWTVNQLRDILLNVQTSVQKMGWGAIYFENHDQNRSINKYFDRHRLDISDVTKKLLGTILLGFRGPPVIYEGEEIGMENIQLDSINQYEDAETHHQYNSGVAAGLAPDKRQRAHPDAVGRLGEGRFSTGNPWFPVNPNYTTINVAEALKNKKSVYYHYRTLLQMRNSAKYKVILVYGKTVPKYSNVDNIIAYERVLGIQSVLFFANFQNDTIELDHSEFRGEILSNNYDEAPGVTNGTITISPYQALVIDISQLS